MELSFTTFFLEIINFLILVWILKRLFFAPVKRVIEQRRQQIQDSLDQAAKTSAQAASLREQYENRLRDWEQEKSRQRETLVREIAAEKEKRLTELTQALQDERSRRAAQEQSENRERREREQNEAIHQSLAFLSGLLKNFAGPDLDRLILRFLVDSLSRGFAIGKGDITVDPSIPVEVEIRSAFTLGEESQLQLVTALQSLLAAPLRPHFSTDASLLSGLEVSFGAKVLRANLRDEMADFAKVANHD